MNEITTLHSMIKSMMSMILDLDRKVHPYVAFVPHDWDIIFERKQPHYKGKLYN